MNPCPCGFLGDAPPDPCRCTPVQVRPPKRKPPVGTAARHRIDLTHRHRLGAAAGRSDVVGTGAKPPRRYSHALFQLARAPRQHAPGAAATAAVHQRAARAEGAAERPAPSMAPAARRPAAERRRTPRPHPRAALRIASILRVARTTLADLDEADRVNVRARRRGVAIYR